MTDITVIVNPGVPDQPTGNPLTHQHRVEVLRLEYLHKPFRCSVSVVKGSLNLRRGYNVELWGVQPGIGPDVADVMPAVPGAEVIRKACVVVNVHARIPRNSGIAVGVARRPVARSLRRGTPTSAVKTPLLCESA